MKKKSLKALLLAAIVLLTVAAAVVHLTTRTAVPKGVLRIVSGSAEVEFALSELGLQHVQGTISNDKGEQRVIDAQGLPVAEVLALAEAADFSKITVTADDAYQAELTIEEAVEAENAYFILQEDGGIQMVVFHDTNSKRNVSDVISLELS